MRTMVLGAAAGLCLSTVALAQDTIPPERQADIAFARSLSGAFKHAAERIEPSVVHITSRRLVQPVRRDRFGREYQSCLFFTSAASHDLPYCACLGRRRV